MLDRLASIEELDGARIADAIQHTRFPYSTAPEDLHVHEEAALLRAADLIGQLGDPHYLKKANALYHEFEEIGLNGQLGYELPADLVDKYPQFYWGKVSPYIRDAIRYLNVSASGRQWISGLYSNVFRAEHELCAHRAAALGKAAAKTAEVRRPGILTPCPARASPLDRAHRRQRVYKRGAEEDPMNKSSRIAASHRLDLTHRPRRNRKAEWARRLVAEHVLTASDLIWPLFLIEGEKRRVPVAAMPGVDRLSVDEAVREAERAVKLEIPAIAFFPYTEADLKDAEGSEAFNEGNLVCQACRAIKREFPELGLVTDVALDPYTSHGHDGLMRESASGELVILNDETVEALVRQALNQARAGADVIAPSDMMDGRVGAIRDALDAEGFLDVQIMAYAAKYASAFYGPFRDALGSAGALKGDKRTYQMDPANSDEALREVELDLDEGADMVMVKPGHALSRHHPPGEGRIRRADLRLSGQRRIFDDHGRGEQWLDRRRQGDDGEPHRVQARRRRRGADLLCAAGGGEAARSMRTVVRIEFRSHSEWRLL